MKLIKKSLLVLSSVLPSIFRIYLLKLLGFKVNKTARVGMFTLLLADEIEMGQYAKIGALTLIKCEKKLVLKDNAEISSFVLIYGEGSLLMDSATYIGPKAMLNVSRDITIGYYSAIGPGSLVYTHGVWHPYTDGYPRKFAPVTLKSYVWVPAKVFIAPGVEIGKNTIIASGENLFKNVPENVFYTGGGKKPSMPIQFVISKEETHQRIIKLLTEFIYKFNPQNEVAFSNTSNPLWFEYNFNLNGRKFYFAVSEGPANLKQVSTRREKPDTIYFVSETDFDYISDDYQIFCFRPIVCSKTKTSLTKQLKSFFERECGLRFGINEPLKQYFPD